MTLQEACDSLRDYLQKWYDNKKLEKKLIRPIELRDAKKEYVKLNPEFKDHEFDIYYDFVAVDGSYSPGCYCCPGNETKVTVKGIVVEPINWFDKTLIALI